MNSVWILIETDTYNQDNVLGVCSSKAVADATIEALMRETFAHEIRAEECAINGVSRKILSDMKQSVEDARATLRTYETLVDEIEPLL